MMTGQTQNVRSLACSHYLDSPHLHHERANDRASVATERMMSSSVGAA